MNLRKIFRRGNYPEKLMNNLKRYYDGLAIDKIDEMLVNDAFDKIDLEIRALKEAITPKPVTYTITSVVDLGGIDNASRTD